MERLKSKTALFITDTAMIGFSIYLTYFLQFHGNIPSLYQRQAITFAIVAIVTCILMLYYYRLYSRIWRYASVMETIGIVKSVVISCAFSFLFIYIIDGQQIHWNILVMSIQTMTLSMGGVRFLHKYVTLANKDTYATFSKALIIGAGDCGSLVVKELRANPAARMNPVAFIDDDQAKHNNQISGILVVGSRKDIRKVVADLNIEHIIISLPSLPKSEIRKIIDICKQTNAKLKIVPLINDLISGKVTIEQMRDVQVEDLLGREPVYTDLVDISNYIKQKNILVTGAGGSIGSELCRQIARFQPQQLVLLGHGENSIYTIEMELRHAFPMLAIIPVIADVQHRARMEQIFEQYVPQVVFHAAAHKHVPLMERNPTEAVKNNVFGTRNVAECAKKFNAERFVFISTDKAVNPTSVMGTTKRIAEMMTQSLDEHSTTIFTAVRFGNVLGSRGSVIPQFKQQIKRGGPITVTHPEMVRYFMTIPEAVQLVIQAGAYANGGEVFVLDMGEPVKIVDLAEGLIRASGLEPHVDIDIMFSGTRPGEKLYEELLTSEEELTSTVHNRIFIGQASQTDWKQFKLQVNSLERVLEQPDKVRFYLKQLVPSYHAPEWTGQDKQLEIENSTKELVLTV